MHGACVFYSRLGETAVNRVNEFAVYSFVVSIVIEVFLNKFKLNSTSMIFGSHREALRSVCT